MSLDKITKIISNPKKIMSFFVTRFFVNLNDESYLKLWYFSKTLKKLDLDNPKTFNEKLQWLKLNDRNPLYTKLVDKYLVKEYIAEKIGEKYIIPTLGVWDRFEDIDFEELPDQFVLKCTHDSGSVIICRDKSQLDLEDASKKLTAGLAKNYYMYTREYVYKDIQPRIIAEKYMVDESGTELKDYKFFCFGGQPELMLLSSGRNAGNIKVDFFDMGMKKLPFEVQYPNSNIDYSEPEGFDVMKMLAQQLSADIPHVRVDFYNINGEIYFGEMTFYHGAGIYQFNPEEWNKTLGDMIKLPKQ